MYHIARLSTKMNDQISIQPLRTFTADERINRNTRVQKKRQRDSTMSKNIKNDPPIMYVYNSGSKLNTVL